MSDTEWIRTTEIARVVAKLMWGTRGVVLYEMEAIMAQEKLKSSEKFLIDGEDTVFSYLFNTAVLIKSIRGDEYNEAECWMTDSLWRQLSFRSHLVNLDDFLKMQVGLREEYNTILKDEVFFGEDIPEWYKREIDIRSLVDDPQNNTAGYCFIDHPQNGLNSFFTLYGEWLLSSPAHAADFAEFANGEIIWKSAPCFRLLTSFSKLRRISCNLKIIGVGPSVRATEVSRDLLRNQSGTALRSFMLLFHNVTIVGIQDKTSHKILKQRFTVGTPDDETAQDLVKQITYFRKWESDIVRFFLGDTHAERYNLYLWPDVKANFSGEDISESLGDATEEYLGTGLMMLEYRHVLSAFMRYHFGEENDLEGDKYYDLLSNHSTRTSQHKYGVSRATLANAPMHHIRGCMEATIRWQKLAKLEGKRPLRLQIEGPTRVLIPDVAEEVNAAPATFTRNDIKAVVVETLEARAVEEEARLEKILKKSLSKLAVALFPKAPPPPLPTALLPPTSVLVDVSRLGVLRQFLNNKNANFRTPQQGELIEKMLTRVAHVLAVVPCDFGKSLICMLIAKMYDHSHITVVILPLSGLQHDFHTRAKNHGLRMHRWDDNQTSDDSANICYASVELDISENFFNYLTDLDNKGRLARIVFDELHLLVTSYHYREPMRRIINTFRVKTHITGLTATIPPQLVPDVFEITGIDNWDIMRIMPTQRPNVQYCVIVRPRATYLQDAIDYVQRRLKSPAYTPKDKAMIFCRSRSTADTVAKAFGVQAYTSETPDADRPVIFDNWTSGKTQVMVCTSILGIGVDQQVVDVVHINVGWSWIDQAQEDNGGRNNRPSWAIYYVPEGETPRAFDPARPFGAEQLLSWVYNKTECRRIKMSLFLDGVAVNCMSMRNASFCDNCLRQFLDKDRVPPSTPLPTPVAQIENTDDSVSASVRPRSLIVAGAPPLPPASVKSTALPMGNPQPGPAAQARMGMPRPMGTQQPQQTVPATMRMAATSMRSAPAASNGLDEEEGPEVYGVWAGASHPAVVAAVPPPPPSEEDEDLSWDPYGPTLWQLQPQLRDLELLRTHGSGPPQSINSAPAPQNSPNDLIPPPIRANVNPAPAVGMTISIGHAAQQQAKNEGCAPCWARGYKGWQSHDLASCEDKYTVERDDYTDEFFKGWSPSALRGVTGCCWGCCLPQGKIGQFKMHKWVDDLANCPNRDIIKSAIYAWVLHPLDAIQPRDYAPQHVVHDFTVFWGWLSLIDHSPLLNLHVVFAKLVIRYFRCLHILVAERQVDDLCPSRRQLSALAFTNGHWLAAAARRKWRERGCSKSNIMLAETTLPNLETGKTGSANTSSHQFSPPQKSYLEPQPETRLTPWDPISESELVRLDRIHAFCLNADAATISHGLWPYFALLASLVVLLEEVLQCQLTVEHYSASGEDMSVFVLPQLPDDEQRGAFGYSVIPELARLLALLCCTRSVRTWHTVSSNDDDMMPTRMAISLALTERSSLDSCMSAWEGIADCLEAAVAARRVTRFNPRVASGHGVPDFAYFRASC
ncbi:hypothetical protein B0H13DRAFT_1862245 [Mycena leptocephala]|nr:hypothetical protein B0H13DRAFT_1862245 [Mycena leptocephala]